MAIYSLSACKQTESEVLNRNMHSTDDSSKIEETGRDILPDHQPEKENYGLYSYLLFTHPPISDADKERYLIILNAFYEMVLPIRVFDSGDESSRKKLNIVYLPVKKSCTIKKFIDEEISNQVEMDKYIQKNLQCYSHKRARRLLKIFDKKVRSGIFLVSVPYRLSRSKVSKHKKKLFMNLTPVIKEDVAKLWVKEFLLQTSSEDFSKQDSFRITALKLRTYLGAASESVPYVVENIEKFIGFQEAIAGPRIP